MLNAQFNSKKHGMGKLVRNDKTDRFQIEQNTFDYWKSERNAFSTEYTSILTFYKYKELYLLLEQGAHGYH